MAVVGTGTPALGSHDMAGLVVAIASGSGSGSQVEEENQAQYA